MGLVLLVAATFALATACNWKADGPARIEHLYPTPGVDIVVHDIAAEIVPTPDLSGSDLDGSSSVADIQLNNFWGNYVVEMKLPATMELFPGYPPYALLLTNLFVASWSDDGLDWIYCTQNAALDADGLGATEMLPGTDNALGKIPFVLDTQEGIGIAKQSVAWTWGIKDMDDPFNDPLPTEPDDLMVWDQDEDSNPGVTIKVLQPSGFRYMVRRSVWNLETPEVMAAGQRLEGSLDFSVDEGAIGYDGPKTLGTIVPIVPDPGGGTYTMVRTDKYYSCEQLLAEYPDIF